MQALDPGEYPGLSLEAFLGHVAAPSPAPAGGSVAAVAVALAASLCGLAARKSPAFPGGADATATVADALRDRALSLASEDAVAYGRVLEAQRMVAAAEEVEPALDLIALLAAALSAAADVPIEIARIAAEVSRLASTLATSGSPNLVGDSLTAALLAGSAAEAAAALVAINLVGTSGGFPEDDRLERAADLAGQAAAAAASARAAAEASLGAS